ncbi:MAG: BspA family leucine-rich repeat surface protein [Paludibacteraceae bacterium]|nr:BspA family leucine-rich repeat surface protein [Paludibacteraceae bacterium]
MKKLYLLALAGLMVLGATMQVQAGEKKAYTEFVGNTLTYYYDDQYDNTEVRTGTVEFYNPDPMALEPMPEVRFKGYNNKIGKVVFDESMKDNNLLSMRNLFCGWDDDAKDLLPLMALLSVEGLENLNTEHVIDMRGMFSYAINIDEFDLSGINTSNAKSMLGMFTGCMSLTKLDVSGLDTKQVTDMSNMFAMCNVIESLDLSSFNTENVTDMAFMFQSCEKLKTITFGPDFKTDKVTDMNYMFAGTAVASLDLSGFNTGNVEEMTNMFCECASLESLDLSSFNTSKVKKMGSMFYECSSLKSITFGKNFSAGEECYTMFNKCTSLTELVLNNFDVSRVKNMTFLFRECSNLEAIYCSKNWGDIATEVTNSSDMFYGCTKLKGDNGTVYDELNANDITFARPDGGPGAEGYFSAVYSGEKMIDGINYYLDGSTDDAQVIDLDGGDKYEGDIAIPMIVSYAGNDYTVTSISDIAFTNCPELLSVSLPKSINWIEPNAFLSNPKLTAINVAAANADYSSLDGVLFNKDKTELIVYPTGKEGAYTVPDGVETILDDGFADNTYLTAVTLPASLTEIASLAFENCTGLTSITSLATTAPHAGSQAFDNVPKSIPVFVPKDGLASYKAEDEWKDFDNFITLEDKAAAEAVVAKIEAIGTVEYTDECKAKIDDARKDYDALSEGAKKVITAEQLKVLTDAEAEYAALKKKAEDDKAAADAVIGKIDAIGTVEYTDACKILIDDARKAYDALTDDQKALITAEQLKVLTDAEAKYAELKAAAEKAAADKAAADAVIGKIDAIGTVEYTDACKEKIDAAREAYDKLTADQKALIADEKYKVLTDAETEYEALKKAAADKAAADAVIDKIDAIGTVEYTDACKILIDDARGAYDKLTEDQKALISDEKYKVLTDAEAKYAELKAAAEKEAADKAAADAVIGKIDAIGTVEYTDACKILIDDARGAYDKLTEDQKALITAEQLKVLTDAEAKYAELKAAAEKAAAKLAKAKEELNAVIAELEVLKNFAHDNGLTEIEASLGFSITTAKGVADNEGATIEQVQGATTVAQNTLSSAEDSLLTIAKTRFKAELDKLLKPEDSDACKQIIADAKDDVDAITIDKEKSAAENIAAVQKAGEDILNKAKADLEAQRKSEETPTGVESIQNSAISSQKVLRDGHIYILVGDKMYDATGKLVK